MADRVQRWVSIVVGLAVVVVIGWITIDQTGRRPHDGADGGAVADAAPASTTASTTTITSSSAAPPLLEDVDGGLELAPMAPLDDAGSLQGAPRTVRLGVVLVQFAGAEGASSAAPQKKDALVRAQQLAADAKADFKHAVKDGDAGSSEDIGRIPRGVLDPRTEIAVFNLAAGDVSDVLDTPRGYWIVKRLE
jgi:hypothetical protein